MSGAVVVASNRAAAGVYDDTTGPLLVDLLVSLGFSCDPPLVVPDGEPVGGGHRGGGRRRRPRGADHRRHRPDADRPDPRGHPGAARPRGARHRRGDPRVRRRQGRPDGGAVARPRRRRRRLPRGQPARVARRREGRASPSSSRCSCTPSSRSSGATIDHRRRHGPWPGWPATLQYGDVTLRPLRYRDARAWRAVRRAQRGLAAAVGRDRAARRGRAAGDVPQPWSRGCTGTHGKAWACRSRSRSTAGSPARSRSTTSCAARRSSRRSATGSTGTSPAAASCPRAVALVIDHCFRVGRPAPDRGRDPAGELQLPAGGGEARHPRGRVRAAVPAHRRRLARPPDLRHHRRGVRRTGCSRGWPHLDDPTPSHRSDFATHLLTSARPLRQRT